MDLSKRLGITNSANLESHGEVVLLSLVISVMSEVKAQTEALESQGGPALSAELEALVAKLPSPSPEWSPKQVIQIQLAALKFPNHPFLSSGYQKLFEFCAPRVKEQFGPAPRFVQMMLTSSYLPLQNYQRIEFGPLFQSTRHAWQPFAVQAANGNFYHYHIGLQKRIGGPQDGCWLVECLNPE